MEFREATLKARAANIGLADIAEALGVTEGHVAKAVMVRPTEYSRNPPAGWQAAVAKLARRRAAELVKLADQLERGSA